MDNTAECKYRFAHVLLNDSTRYYQTAKMYIKF